VLGDAFWVDVRALARLGGSVIGALGLGDGDDRITRGEFETSALWQRRGRIPRVRALLMRSASLRVTHLSSVLHAMTFATLRGPRRTPFLADAIAVSAAYRRRA